MDHALHSVTNAFDSMAAGVWVIDSQFRTTYVKARMAMMLGRSPAEMQGVPLLDFVPDDARAGARSYLDGSRQGGDEQTDLPLLSKDGSLRWVLVSTHRLSPDLVDRANVDQASLVCVMVDITERKRIEDSLRQSQAHYNVLADTAEDHIFVINREDRVEYVNQAGARQLQSVPERVIGRRRSEIFPPDIAERQGHGLQHVFITGKPLYVEGHTLYLEREVWLGTWLAPVIDAQGHVNAVLGLSRDMTEHKQADDALRASEQRLQMVLSNVPLVLWASDRNGVATFCGGRALEGLGGVPADVVGKTFDAIGIEPFPAISEHVRRAVAGESFGTQIGVGDSTFDAWFVPLRDEHQIIAGATGIIVDVTERRRLEAELSDAQKLEAIGRLAGGIAHDFNNNLTAILGYVEMMIGEADANSQVARDLGEVKFAGERAAGLVRRLLAFGRRQVLQPRNLNLNEVIESLESMLGRLIGEDVQIVVTLAADPWSVTGDPGEFEQVIMNLALNARDAMPSGGTLRIETANATVSEKDRRPTMPPGPHVLLTISDTGIGMDSHTRAHVFEPFFTTKPAGKGTGLGLSTVYGIVKQLNGFIWVESELGQGSVFRVYVPAAAGKAVPQPVPAAATPKPASVRRETILLVEDEETVRRFAKTALELHGFQVIAAASPDEALSLAGDSQQPIPLLLTDVVMPQMGGPELADRLKRTRPDLAVIYMSGYPSTLVQGGMLDTSTRLISKPFTTAELLASIDEALGKS